MPAPGDHRDGDASGQGWRPSERPTPRRSGRIVASFAGVLLVAAFVASVLYAMNRPPPPPVKRTAAQMTATAVAASIILADPLNMNTHGWQDDGSRCYFDAAGYHVQNATICYAPFGSQVNGVESVTMKQIAGPVTHGYGLVFRRVSAGNYYNFVITSNGEYAVFIVQNNTLRSLVSYTSSSAIHIGLNQVNTISVTMTGADFDCYINGVKIARVHDTTFPEGAWGLDAYSTDNVVFTDYLARRN